MADVNANIGVGIDTSDALGQLKNLQRQISTFHQSVAKSSATAAAAQRDLQKNFINSVNAIQGFSAELRTVKTTAESFSTSLEKNKLSVREYFRYAAGATKTFGKNFKSEFDTIEKTAVERVKTLQTQFVKVGRDANGAMKAISIRPTVLDMQDLGTQTAIAGQKQAIFNQLVKQGSTNLLNFGKNTQWAGRQLMVGFTLPLATLGMTASRTFMQMEQAVIKFRKVYGDLFTTQEETDQALEGIVELAKQYTKYGVVVADTVAVASDAAAAGFKGLDLQRQTAAATKLSVLGQIDQQKALETTISLTNAFGTSSEELASNIDFLNAVENQTVTSLDDITTAIPKVSPVIKQMGGDVKDLAYFLTAMKEGGINASEGANALKSGLAAMINPTGKASEFLKGFGINLKGIVEANKGDVKGTVTEFALALDKLDPLNRAQAIEQLFGKFQFARLSTLFANVAKDGTQASRVLDLAGSSVEDLAALSEKELGQTAASAMNKFKKAIEEIKLALVPLGELFLEIATPFVDFATGVVEKFNAMPEGVRKAIGTLVAVVGGLGPVLLMTFGLINNGIANMIKFFNNVRLGYLKITGQASGIAAETQYMTNEQLDAAAAAASLNQAHSTLTQQFTVEKVAVDQLKVAYEQAAAAGQRFATINPGMMMPGKPQKFANGGFVKGPGTGRSDSIAAMISNGEAIIPAAMAKKYAPLVQGIIAGSIPGFKDGTEFAHIGDRTPIGAKTASGMMSADAVSGRAFRVVEELAKKFGDAFKVNVYGKLGIRTGKTAEGKSINNALGKEGVSQADFLADWDKQGLDRWKSSLKFAGLKMDDVKEDLEKIDIEMKAYIQSLDKSVAIQDKHVAEAYKAATAKVGPTGVGSAFGRLQSTAGEVRANISQSWADKGNLPSAEGGGSKGAAMVGNTKVRLGGDRFTFYTKAGFDIVDQASQAMTDGSRDALKIASPSKEAEIIGQQTGQGLLDGIEKGMTQSGRSRRAGTNGPVTPQGSGTGKFMQYEASGKKRVIAEDLYVRNMAAREKAMQRLSAIQQGRMQKLTAGMNTASLAITSLAGIGTMFGGKLGEISGVIMGLSGSLFALIQITQLLAQTKLQEVLATRMSVAKAAVVGEAGTIFSKGAKGFVGGLKAFGTGLLNIGKIFLRFLGPVGIAITVLGILGAVVGAIVDAKKKEEAAVQGLGDAAVLAGNKLKGLGDYFGVATSGQDFYKKITGEGGGKVDLRTKQERKAVDDFKKSDTFKDQFNTSKDGQQSTVEALRGATDAQAKIALNSISLGMQGQGFTKEQIATVVTAIKEEAGKTDLELDFKNIDIKTEEGRASLKKDTDSLLKDVSDNFANGMKEVTKYSRAKNGAVIMTKSMVPDSKDLKKAMATASKTIASNMANIGSAFKNGVINGKQFKAAMGDIATSIKALPKPQGLLMLDELLAQTGLDANLLKAAQGIDDVNLQIELLNALAAGVPIDSALISAMEVLGDKASYSGQQIAAATNAVNAWRAATETDFTKIETAAKTDFQTNNEGGSKSDPIGDAIKNLKAQKKEIINTSASYKALTKTGMDAGQAMEMATNPELLAAMAAGVKVGSAKWKELISLIKQAKKEQDKLNESTPTGKTDAFNAVYDKVSAVFSTQEALMDATFEAKTKGDNALVAKLEKDIEGYNRQIEGYENSLDKIAEKEDAINKAYDEKAKSLEQVRKVNEQILNQQKSQQSIAEALSKGDVSAAASAIQDSRAQNAQAALDSQSGAMDAARQAQLKAVTDANGLTRETIEGKIKTLKESIYNIETGSLRQAQDRIDKEQELLDTQKAALEVGGKSKTEWDNIKLSIDAAQARGSLYTSEVNKALNKVKEIKDTWEKIPKTITLTRYIKEVVIPSGKTTTAAKGGYMPQYLAAGGPAFNRFGSDTVPAMLTPGEFVVNRASTKRFAPLLEAINKGNYRYSMPSTPEVPKMYNHSVYNMPVRDYVQPDAGVVFPRANSPIDQSDNSVYNYNLSVNVDGGNLNADDVANQVITQLRKLESQRIRSQVIR